MKRTVFALPLAVLTIAGLLASSADAQEAKKTRGKVTALTATNLTLDVTGTAMNFAIDPKTKVEAPGAGTATRRAEAAGKQGLGLGGQGTEIVHQAEAATVIGRDRTRAGAEQNRER